MKNIKWTLLAFVVCIIIAVICTRVYTIRGYKPVERIVHDTTFIENPVHDTSYVTSYVRVPIEVHHHDTISNVVYEVVHDTTFVVLPVTTKRYSGISDTYEYTAWVSGYEPSLDSLSIVTQTRYEVSTVYKMPKFDILPYASVKADDLFTFSVGVEAMISHNRFQFVPKIGYEFSTTPYHGMVGEFELRYSLWSK